MVWRACLWAPWLCPRGWKSDPLDKRLPRGGLWKPSWGGPGRLAFHARCQRRAICRQPSAPAQLHLPSDCPEGQACTRPARGPARLLGQLVCPRDAGSASWPVHTGRKSPARARPLGLGEHGAGLRGRDAGGCLDCLRGAPRGLQSDPRLREPLARGGVHMGLLQGSTAGPSGQHTGVLRRPQACRSEGGWASPSHRRKWPLTTWLGGGRPGIRAPPALVSPVPRVCIGSVPGEARERIWARQPGTAQGRRSGGGGGGSCAHAARP